MGRKKSEEIKENVVDEATEKETVTSTGETLEEMKGESIGTPAEENNIEATEKVLEEKEFKAKVRI